MVRVVSAELYCHLVSRQPVPSCDRWLVVVELVEKMFLPVTLSTVTSSVLQLDGSHQSNV